MIKNDFHVEKKKSGSNANKYKNMNKIYSTFLFKQISILFSVILISYILKLSDTLFLNIFTLQIQLVIKKIKV